MSNELSNERLKSDLAFAESLGPDTAVMTTQEAVRAVLADAEMVWVTADGSHITGERAVDLYDDQKATNRRLIEEREEMRKRVELAEADLSWMLAQDFRTPTTERLKSDCGWFYFRAREDVAKARAATQEDKT